MTGKRTVGEVCTPARTVRMADSLRTVVQMLSSEEIGIVIVERDGRPVGVVSERDVVRGLMLHDELALEGHVLDMVAGDVMSEGVVTISPDASTSDAVALMADHGVRHLMLTIDDGPAVVSLRDVV